MFPSGSVGEFPRVRSRSLRSIKIPGSDLFAADSIFLYTVLTRGSSVIEDTLSIS